MTAVTRKWGAAEPPRWLTHPRAFAVLTGPGRPSAFATLRGSLLFQNLQDGENRINLSLVPKAGAPEPAVVKLLDSNGLLLDVVGIEKTKPR